MQHVTPQRVQAFIDQILASASECPVQVSVVGPRAPPQNAALLPLSTPQLPARPSAHAVLAPMGGAVRRLLCASKSTSHIELLVTRCVAIKEAAHCVARCGAVTAQLRVVCQKLHRIAGRKFPDSKFLAVGSFFFLRCAGVAPCCAMMHQAAPGCTGCNVMHCGNTACNLQHATPAQRVSAPLGAAYAVSVCESW